MNSPGSRVLKKDFRTVRKTLRRLAEEQHLTIEEYYKALNFSARMEKRLLGAALSSCRPVNGFTGAI